MTAKPMTTKRMTQPRCDEGESSLDLQGEREEKVREGKRGEEKGREGKKREGKRR